MTETAPTRSATRARRLVALVPRGDWVGLGLLLVLGAAVRATGFSTTDLWYDDAWAAMVAKVPLARATHMVVTTPGYSLAMRSWIRLDPGVTWFAQLPAFGFALAGLVVVDALLRVLRVRSVARWIALGVLTVSPTTVTEATRVKEYAFDLVVGALVLLLGERLRRGVGNPWNLVVVSVLGVACSAGTSVAVVAVWAVLALVAVVDPSRRRSLVPPLATVAALVTVLAAWTSTTTPAILHANWRRRGFLVDWSSGHGLRFSLQSVFAGLAHNLLAIPSQPAAFHGAIKVVTAVLAVVVGVAIVAATVTVVNAVWTTRSVDAATLPVAVVALATACSLAGLVPMGDGRTDEVLYPAILASACLLLPRIRWPRRQLSARGRLVLAGLALTGGLAFAVTHTARYPTIDLRSLAAELHRAPYSSVTTVAVETFDGFTWGYDDLSPNRVVLGQTDGLTFPMGFHVASTDPSVVIAAHNGEHVWPRSLTSLSRSTTKLWYVGYELGTYDPYRPNGSTPQYGPLYRLLVAEGWHRALFPVLGQHCFALLMTHA